MLEIIDIEINISQLTSQSRRHGLVAWASEPKIKSAKKRTTQNITTTDRPTELRGDFFAPIKRHMISLFMIKQGTSKKELVVIHPQQHRPGKALTASNDSPDLNRFDALATDQLRKNLSNKLIFI